MPPNLPKGQKKLYILHSSQVPKYNTLENFYPFYTQLSLPKAQDSAQNFGKNWHFHKILVFFAFFHIAAAITATAATAATTATTAHQWQ